MWLKVQLMIVTLLLGLLANLLHVSPADYAPAPDLLQRKGYSPETVQTIDTQRYHQEWRYPPKPKRTPKQQFWHNVKLGDPMGYIDPFGDYTMRERL